MKKFKKLAAALSAAIIAVSAFSVPVSVSAYTEPDTQSYEYLTDNSNLAWTDGSLRVYKDGTVACSFLNFSSVILKPAEGADITAETLGLPDGCDVVHLDSSLYADYNGWLRITTSSEEQVEEISALAGKWTKSGLAVEVQKLNTITSCCVSGLCFTVSLNNTDDADTFLSDYEKLGFPESDTNTYWSKTFSQDEIVAAGDSYYALKADERVKSVTANYIQCCVVHQIYDTEDIGSVVPTDYASAQKFYENHAETVVDGNEAVIVVPGIDDENYGYVFADGGEGKAYTVKSHKRYVEEINSDEIYSDSYVKNSYDVYVLELNSDSDIKIEMQFINLNYATDDSFITDIRLCYTLQKDGTYKVSDRPTTGKQLEKFISQNGNIKVNDDNAVVVIKNVGAICAFECSSPVNTVKPALVNKDEVGNMWYTCHRNSEGEVEFVFACGTPIYSVYQFSLDKNEKYGLKFISAQQYTETAETPYGYVKSFNYTIEKNENGAELLSESAEEYEVTPYGDVNFDSVVDLYDAISISRYIMNPDSLNEIELYSADFNRDGKKDLYDVIDIAKTLM